VIKKSDMPIVVKIVRQQNLTGAKGHYFRQVFKEKEYFRIGRNPTNETGKSDDRLGKSTRFSAETVSENQTGKRFSILCVV
jgi:hypothetical protein